MQILKTLITIIISAKERGVSLVPIKVTNSLIPTEKGVRAIRKEKSTNEVINKDKNVKFSVSIFFKIRKKIKKSKIYCIIKTRNCFL